MILAGDIGGTKSNLALMEKKGDRFRVVFIYRYPSHEYTRFGDIIDDFLSRGRDFLSASPTGRIAAAGFGVAGPVIGRGVRITNLTWGLDADSLERQLGTPHVVLLNDLEATGYSLAWLAPEDICTLNEGSAAPQATQALIAAGTGLGEAILMWNGSRYIVAPSEGGHADFAPRTEKEIELLRYLKTMYKFVSFELVVSGRGFLTLHEFLNKSVRHRVSMSPERTRRRKSPSWVSRALVLSVSRRSISSSRYMAPKPETWRSRPLRAVAFLWPAASHPRFCLRSKMAHFLARFAKRKNSRSCSHIFPFMLCSMRKLRFSARPPKPPHVSWSLPMPERAKFAGP